MGEGPGISCVVSDAMGEMGEKMGVVCKCVAQSPRARSKQAPLPRGSMRLTVPRTQFTLCASRCTPRGAFLFMINVRRVARVTGIIITARAQVVLVGENA